METILDKIVATKQKEINLLLDKGYAVLEQQPNFNRVTISLKKRIVKNQEIHLITEFKRKSPSKGNINLNADITVVTNSYQEFGCSAISILTDKLHFGGTNEDIILVRPDLNVPILRKEFMLHEIQLLEAKAIGADLILLIAACLTPKEVKTLATAAKNLGLEVLLELHDESELNHICTEVDFIGINNRNLKDFKVSLEHSMALRNKIGKSFISVAESGMKSKEDVVTLHQCGFDAFLIGEHLMKQENIGAAITELKSIIHE